MSALMFLLRREQGVGMKSMDVYQGRISTAYKGASHQLRLLLA